jgi:outer membrane receptor protein involved in Fe transport
VAFYGTRAAAADPSPNASASASSSSRASSPQTVSEVIVTAEKRDERLMQTPAPVAVVNAATLVATNQVTLSDYYAQVPGLNFTTDIRGTSAVSIRGLSTTLFENPTVATLIDDVPYTFMAAASSQPGLVELDPNDISQVEILRGPQGVLYGAASLGGIIKYDTVRPSTEGLNGQIDIGATGVSHSDDAGYNVGGAINVPISKQLAIRASGLYRSDPGYVDNVLTGQDDVNSGHVGSGRLAVLWRPSQDFLLEVSALFQDRKLDGSPIVESSNPFAGGAPLGDLQQADIRDSGVYDRELRSYAAKMLGTLGGINITSVTAYTSTGNKGNLDFSYVFVPLGLPATAVVDDNHSNKFTQELRFDSTLGHFDWLLGGFYTRETVHLNQGFTFYDPMKGVPVGPFLNNIAAGGYEEGAVFGDVTYHLTKRLDIQLGGRYSDNRQTFGQSQSTFGGPPVITPKSSSTGSSFTYLVTPKWKITEDLMVYARFASGYRPGGPNAFVTPGSGLPTNYGPDTTDNYEVGLKGFFFDHKLSIDGSAYYIDWKNIQITNTQHPSGISYVINGPGATSKGVEVTVSARPLPGMTIGATASWNDARLSEGLPVESGEIASKGDRLPYSSPFTGNISLDQEFALTGEATGFGGLSLSYVSARQDEFGQPGFPRVTNPAYTQVNVDAGVHYKTLTVTVYVNNVGDKRGILQDLANIPGVYSIIQPRNAGIQVSKKF